MELNQPVEPACVETMIPDDDCSSVLLLCVILYRAETWEVAPINKSLKANNRCPSFNVASAKEVSFELYFCVITFSILGTKSSAVKGNNTPSNLSGSGLHSKIYPVDVSFRF